jgi:hypothetical protein
MPIVSYLLGIAFFCVSCVLDAQSSLGQPEKYKVYRDSRGYFSLRKYALISLGLLSLIAGAGAWAGEADYPRGYYITTAILAGDAIRRMIAAADNRKRRKLRSGGGLL